MFHCVWASLQDFRERCFALKRWHHTFYIPFRCPAFHSSELINSVISFFLLWQEKTAMMRFMAVIGGKRYFLFTYMTSTFKRRFLFPGCFSSEPRTFPHHCGRDSTFKMWLINAAWSIIRSSFMTYELWEKGSQSTSAGQQPVTAWRAASHSARDWRGFRREFYCSSLFPTLLQPKISCRASCTA